MLFVCVSAIVLQIVGVAVTVAGCLEVGVDVADRLHFIASNRHYCWDTKGTAQLLRAPQYRPSISLGRVLSTTLKVHVRD
jgi:hypothetical protein